MPFPLGALPQELRDKIWETTLGLDGPPIIQCLEMDLLQGNKDTLSPDWYEPPHTPAICPPTFRRGGHVTFNASHYLHVQNVAEAEAEARDALEHFLRALRLKTPSDILELKAKRHPLWAKDPVMDEVSVWLNTKRDVLLLQSPYYMTARHTSPDLSVFVNWFCATPWVWSWRDSFRPLPFFGLDRVERVAIDWHLETKRRSIRRTCDLDGCGMLRIGYNVELYQTPRENRKYCTVCLGKILEGWNKAVQDGEMDPDSLDTHVETEFRGTAPDYWNAEYLGTDEPGSFICKNCNKVHLCANGRLSNIVNQTPYDVTEIEGWQPKCLAWHHPAMESDIETLFMGRMPSLKTFYVIDTAIKLKQPASTSPLLCRPHEVFEGHNCKFVEVDPEEAAWDLDPKRFPRCNPMTDPSPFTSFSFADKLRRAVWKSACHQHAALIYEQRASYDPYDAAKTEVPLEKQPLNQPITESQAVYAQIHDLQFPMMGPSPSLVSEWPDSLLPVKVKVMARVEPHEYWRLGSVDTTH